MRRRVKETQRLIRHLSPSGTCASNQQHVARIDFLAPDVMMTDVSGALISIESLQLGKVIGKGSFGIIYHVREREEKRREVGKQRNAHNREV